MVSMWYIYLMKDSVIDAIFELCDRKHSDKHYELVSLLFKSHIAAAQNNQNISKNAALLASIGNGTFGSACIAGIASIGGVHAPVTQARQVIYRNPRLVEPALRNGELIPGFGNSFYKDRIDPAFSDIMSFAIKEFKEEYIPVVSAGMRIFESGKSCLPNAAAFTALTAEAIGLPDGLEPLLVIIPRSIAWAEDFVANRPNKRLMSI